MTGSQIFCLMQGIQESLAERVALLHMSPLSQREIIGMDCIPFTTDRDILINKCKKIKPIDNNALFENQIDNIKFYQSHSSLKPFIGGKYTNNEAAARVYRLQID